MKLKDDHRHFAHLLCFRCRKLFVLMTRRNRKSVSALAQELAAKRRATLANIDAGQPDAAASKPAAAVQPQQAGGFRRTHPLRTTPPYFHDNNVFRAHFNCDEIYDFEFDRQGYLLVIEYFGPVRHKTRLVEGGVSQPRTYPMRVNRVRTAATFDENDWSGAPTSGPYVRLPRVGRPPLIISPQQAQAARRFILEEKGKTSAKKHLFGLSPNKRPKESSPCCYGCKGVLKDVGPELPISTASLPDPELDEQPEQDYDVVEQRTLLDAVKATGTKQLKVAVFSLVLLLAILATTYSNAGPVGAAAQLVPDAQEGIAQASSFSTGDDFLPTAPTLSAPSTSVPLTTLSSKQQEMQAYDCSEPAEVQSVSLLHDTDIPTCAEQKLKDKQKEKSYLLLQKVHKLKVEVWECTVIISRIFFACGSASHSAIADRESFISKPFWVPYKQCWEMIHKKRYSLPRFDKGIETRNITLGGWNYLTMQRTGWTYNALNITCRGGPVPVGELHSMQHDSEKASKEPMSHMIVTDYVRLKVEKQVTYYVPEETDARLVLAYNSKQIHCPYSYFSCPAELSTYVWEEFKPKDLCPFFLLKTVTGISVPANEEDEKEMNIFVANNDSMIRLKHSSDAISHCDSVMYPTEYPDLYLSTDLSKQVLNRPLAPEEASAFLHATVSDNFIYHKTQENLANAVLGLQRHQCEEHRKRSLSAYAARLAKQKSVTDGDTAHLGDGLFLTASGEVAYLYWCRSLTVRASVHTKQCYNALPIELQPEDQEHLRMILSEPGQDPSEIQLPPMYLEPRSRRLTTVAAPITCVPNFAPLYRNIHGEWLQMTHVGLHKTTEPKDPRKDISNTFFEINRDELPAPGKQSIYSAPTIRHNIFFLAVPNMAITAPLQMANGGQRLRAGHGPDGEGFLPHLDLDLEKQIKDAALGAIGLGGLGQLGVWIEHYGTICSIVVGTICIYNIIVYLMTVWSLLFCNKRRLPWICHVFRAFLPSLANLIIYGTFDPQGPRGPCFRPIEACFRDKNRRRHSSDQDDVETGMPDVLYPAVPNETSPIYRPPASVNYPRQPPSAASFPAPEPAAAAPEPEPVQDPAVARAEAPQQRVFFLRPVPAAQDQD